MLTDYITTIILNAPDVLKSLREQMPLNTESVMICDTSPPFRWTVGFPKAPIKHFQKGNLEGENRGWNYVIVRETTCVEGICSQVLMHGRLIMYKYLV